MSKDIDWRYVWKESVIAGQKSILENDIELTEYFPALYEKYGDDRMIPFEQAITYECLGNFDKAKELYKQSADENLGLPVKHWRKRAKYLYDRLEGNVSEYNDDYRKQWDTFKDIHTLKYLHPHIRYLAISSVSRINNEPEMAIVIFRTCLEISLELYWKEHTDSSKTLGHTINKLFDKEDKEENYNAMKKILYEGNLAAHPFKDLGFQELKERTKEKPFYYRPKEIIYILDAFKTVMKYCDKKAKRSGREILSYSFN